MKDDTHGPAAFTLVELLLVIAIIGILAALLLPVLSAVAARGRQTVCLSNVKQINQGVMMYAADHHDILFPFPKKPDNVKSVFYFQEWTSYVPLIGRYVGRTGAPAPEDKLFTCPADKFHDGTSESREVYWVNESLHSSSNMNYSSYMFNAANAVIQADQRDEIFPRKFPGILGSKLSSISTPTTTILLGEEPAWSPYSWHSPSRPRQFRFNNSLDVLGFADGHVRCMKMFFPPANPPGGRDSSFESDPPAGYDYKWSGN